MVSLAAVKKTPLKKFIAPILALILVSLLLKTAFHQTSKFVATAWSNGTSNATYVATLKTYYSSLGHAIHKPEVEVDNQYVSANVSSSIKVAVIMETRRSAAIIPLILHFSTVLGPDWPVIVYTQAENFGSFSTSSAFIRAQRSGRVVLRSLPDGMFFPSWDSVSDFLTTPWLWRDLAPAEHILLFQSDSILCANAVRSVEDFFQYDLIGAPIVPKLGVGFNGGLSLRRRSTVMRVLEEFNWLKNPHPHPEDQWYFARMKELADQEKANGIGGGINLPSMEIARTFAVETIDYPSPLGLHQPTRFIPVHMLALEEWCPEYRLATTDRIKG